jgi:hypothetical protein
MQSSFQQVRAVCGLVGLWANTARLLLAISSLLAFGFVSAPAEGAEAAMTVEVPAGQFKSLRLRNLPKDAVMAVGVQTNGKLLLVLVNEEDYKRFPKPEEPIFMGSVDRRLSFTVTIPAAGHYFLVFDNRRGQEAQKVKFALRAERGRAPQEQPPPLQQPPLQLEPQPPRPEAPSPTTPGTPKRLDKL